ncbi:MAG: NAD(P)/FAD-dependent oxidoreductase, partial [Acidobacteria bacterium]|nr:NAD(P)/FAD-dependent oxidoreductase [Acidobacteriota bacterium]
MPQGFLGPDAVVVGSGPNGLAAAVTLARAGLRVHVHEVAATVGGGTRSAEITLPGFTHDVCSAVHPMALASPFFKAFGLAERIPFAIPEVSYAHPLDDGRVALAYRSLERTAEHLGVDGGAYRALFAPLVRREHGVMELLNGALLGIPEDPRAALLLGVRALEQGSGAWNQRFRSDLAPALLAGVAAHSMTRLPSMASAAAGLVLGMLGHTSGWPVPLGGSAAISTALVEDLHDHGGVIFCNSPVTN